MLANEDILVSSCFWADKFGWVEENVWGDGAVNATHLIVFW